MKRHRVCDLGHVIQTHERQHYGDLRVQRGSGVVEPFDADKVNQSVMRACAGNISSNDLSKITDDVLRQLDPKPETPITTDLIGRQIIHELAVPRPMAALRYATTFAASRGLISSLPELLVYLAENIPSFDRWLKERKKAVPPTRTEPDVVLKAAHGTGIRYEDFNKRKLFKGLLLSAKGSCPPEFVRQFHADADDFFAGALSAWVIAQTEGQTRVTSGQVAGHVLRVLRSECQFGYLRFAIVSKDLSRFEEFVQEIEGLESHPSASVGIGDYIPRGQIIALEIRQLEAVSRVEVAGDDD